MDGFLYRNSRGGGKEVTSIRRPKTCSARRHSDFYSPSIIDALMSVNPVFTVIGERPSLTHFRTNYFLYINTIPVRTGNNPPPMSILRFFSLPCSRPSSWNIVFCPTLHSNIRATLVPTPRSKGGVGCSTNLSSTGLQCTFVITTTGTGYQLSLVVMVLPTRTTPAAFLKNL